jgi:protein O-mannosyl-transferase
MRLPHTPPVFLSRSSFHVILICLVGLVIYSNTFHVPFQWDEFRFIRDNPIVKDLVYFIEPSKAAGYPLHEALKSRYIGYLTFALDYKIHGLDVTGYHIVNLGIHVVNAVLVYFLVFLTFRTPFLAGSTLIKDSRYVALFAGLFFVAHPLQIEAVTYIFQRLASLVTLFYILSVVLYIKSRLMAEEARGNRQEATGKEKRLPVAFYFFSLLSAVLAMKTKENAFTLPFIILLYEFLFFRGRLKSRLIGLVPLLITLSIIPFTMVDVSKSSGNILQGLDAATHGMAVPRSEYFFTELRVLVTYIRLLVFPLNQNIGYDYPLFHSFDEIPVLLSFLFFVVIFGLAVYLLYRSRSKPELRIMAYGIVWFLISLSIESSIVPIPMVIDEYRVYLPSAGMFMAFSTGIFLLLGRFRGKRRVMISSLSVLIILFSITAYARNSVWKSRISLWEDAVRKAPGEESAHYNLAAAYRSKNLLDRAIEQYQEAIRLKPDYVAARDDLGLAYDSKGLVDEAIEQYRVVTRLQPGDAEAHYNLGIDFMTKGLTAEAVKEYKTAISLRPDYADAYNNLGNAYLATGVTDLAIKQFQTATRLDPDCLEAHYNLGLIYLNRKEQARAVREFEEVLRVSPDNVKARQLLDSAR